MWWIVLREENDSKCSNATNIWVLGWTLILFFFFCSLFDVCNLIVFLSFIWLHDNYEYMLRHIWILIYIKVKCYIHQLYGCISSIWDSARYFWWQNFVTFWFGVESQYFLVILSVLHYSSCNLAKWEQSSFVMADVYKWTEGADIESWLSRDIKQLFS